MTITAPFTAMCIASRNDLLLKLHSTLETVKIDKREHFHDLMKVSFNHCGFDPRRLSDDMGFSHSLVVKWIEGTTAPHPTLWPAAIQWVKEEIVKEIRSPNQ